MWRVISDLVPRSSRLRSRSPQSNASSLSGALYTHDPPLPVDSLVLTRDPKVSSHPRTAPSVCEREGASKTSPLNRLLSGVSLGP